MSKRSASAGRSSVPPRSGVPRAAPPEVASPEPRADSLIQSPVPAPSIIAQGPAKPRRHGAPPPRLNTHKARANWFRARAAWPMREGPVARVSHERELSAKMLRSAPGSSQWEPIGPTNIGGRLTCCACDPKDPDRIFVGSAGGGVWRSTDAGRHWQSLWHDQDVLNVGALAIDPKNPDIIYCGTGEANLSADSYGGVGMYQSRDGGDTWRLLAPCDRNGLPRRIGCIAIDPRDSRHILVGGVGLNEMAQQADVGGLYASHDGGITWVRRTFDVTGNYWCHALLFHPRRNRIYATITARGTASGIYRSDDGGTSWTPLRKGLPDPERMGRTSLAISPSNPDVMYALAADALSESADQLLGVFRSANGGTSWRNIAGTHFTDEGQMSYGNTIAVHPQRPNHVICGGVDLHLTTNGGRSWTRATRWDAERGWKRYAHADHHGLVMPVAAPGRVYDPNDGGLDISEDGGLSWSNRSNGLAVTMYYDIDVAQSDPRAFGGGAQDNGTLITTSGRADDHFPIYWGDGGWMVFDRSDASHVIASCYNLDLRRYHGKRFKNISPPASQQEKDSIWMAFIALHPANNNVIVTGSSRVWLSRDDGDTWDAVSKTLDGSSISAIEIALADSSRIYVGTENGGFFRSVDGGKSWSANLAGSLPGHTITRITTSPRSAKRVYVTLANFGHAHVFRSDDSGVTWKDSDRDQLPDAPHHAVAIPEDAADTLYVCSDAGVHVSTDAGATWMSLSRNLPNVMVVDLVYHEPTRTLYAATYGRSLFKLTAPLG